ncbi:hypothetical protein GGI42DRAFT_332616 [Trichoderma sp. SZMC 28013]
MVIRIYYTRFHQLLLFALTAIGTGRRHIASKSAMRSGSELHVTTSAATLLYSVSQSRSNRCGAGHDTIYLICDLLSRAGHAYSGSSAFAARGRDAAASPHQTEPGLFWACRHRITNPGSHRLLIDNLSKTSQQQQPS